MKVIRTARFVSFLAGILTVDQTKVVFVLAALLMPVAAPIPALSYESNWPPSKDVGIRHATTTPVSSFMGSAMNLAGDALGGVDTPLSPSEEKNRAKEGLLKIAALEEKVENIETELTGDQKVTVGQILSLAGMPIDRSKNPINGLVLQWKSSDERVVKIINESQAVAIQKGEAKLLAWSGRVRREFSVSVTSNGATRTLAVNPAPPEEPVMSEQQAEILVTPENNLGSPPGQTEASSSSAAAALRTRERYGSSNYSFGIPVASLSGRGIDAGIGITYNSRVWDKSDTSGTTVFHFKYDNTWLAPGFQMGFGSLEGFHTASGYGYLLTGPDGTRHQLLERSVSGSCTTYESTDGAFIQTTVCGVYAVPSIVVKRSDGTQVTYGAITQNKRFPVKIQDRNGNYISISYVQDDTQGKIASIRDTRNRYIKFYYETSGDKKLIAMTVPGYNDSSTERQTVRFYYEALTLQTAGRFDSAAQVNAPQAPINVLRYVYFPGTKTGFRYDYSPYFGVISKIWQMRGMVVNGGDNPSGASTITSEGTWAASTHYNYPTTAMETGPPLTDVPKYSLRRDDWQGRTTGVAQTKFESVENVTPAGCRVADGDCTGTRTVTVTAPDGKKSISVSKIRPTGDWENGLLEEIRTASIDASEQEVVWSKMKMYWVQGSDLPIGRDNPRLEKIETTNDAQQTRATSFVYDNYNNQKIIREHGFAAENVLGTELRRTDVEYETGDDWINNRLLRLPKEIKVTVNNTVVSKVKYEYDNYSGVNALANASGVMQHDRQYNPYNPPDPVDPGTHECNCRWECDGQSSGRYCSDGLPAVRICDQCPNPTPPPVPIIYHRGNVTKVIAFPNTSLSDDDLKNSVTVIKYDITGNVIEAGGSCCKKKSWKYDLANGYALPVEEAKGDAGQLVTKVTYDGNTGLARTVTDENGQITTFNHNPDSLRLIRTDSPDGAWSTIDYNDAVYPYHVKRTVSLDATRSVAAWSFFNGRGQGFMSRSQTGSGYLSSEVEFDVMGMAVKEYNPFTVSAWNDFERPADVKFTETVLRDGLDRILKVRLPDNTLLQATYDGLVTTIEDQSGKSRRQVSDALGRTVHVDEPIVNPPDGDALGPIDNPHQRTSYTYDGNDNLATVKQDAGGGIIQEREFVYDSLSQLIRERQVEALPKLDAEGNHGPEEATKWTGVYKYTNDGLLDYAIDARGVKSDFTYDGLNRIKKVEFSGDPAYVTPTVDYIYDETRPEDPILGPFYNKGRLTTIKTQEISNNGQFTPKTIHTYDYNTAGQVINHNQNIDQQIYNLQYGYNLAGQVIKEKYPSGRVIAVTVDQFGDAQTVADSQRTYLNGATASYDSSGMTSQITFGNGTAETFRFNERFQLTSQSLKRGTEVLQQSDYAYGQMNAAGEIIPNSNNGQLAKIEAFIGAAKQRTQKFTYDPIGRLSKSEEYRGDTNALSYKQVFDHDRFGNLYRKTSSNPLGGQQNPIPFTAIEETTATEPGDIDKFRNRFKAGTTYDDAGQVTQDSKFRGVGLAYDANGRIVKATKVDTPDADTVYDALGNRVATKVNGVWQYIIYDAFGQLIAEYGLPSEGIGGVKYVQQDWQGSVRSVTNVHGFVVSRTDYQVFGEEIGAGVGLRSVAQGYSVDKATRQAYGLIENDASSGQLHAWFRNLETKAGRWTRPDPYKGSMNTGAPQSFNRYSYVQNDPVNYTDPSGLDGLGDSTVLAQQLLKSRACQRAVAGREDSNLASQLGRIYAGGQMTIGYRVQRARMVGGKLVTSSRPFKPSEAGAVNLYESKPGSGIWIPYHISMNLGANPWSTEPGSFFPGWETSSGYVGVLSVREAQAQAVLHEFRHWLGDNPSGDHQAKFQASIYIFCFLLNPFRPDTEPIETGPGELPFLEITPRPLTPLIGPQGADAADWGFFMLQLLYAMYEYEMSQIPQ